VRKGAEEFELFTSDEKEGGLGKPELCGEGGGDAGGDCKSQAVGEKRF